MFSYSHVLLYIRRYRRLIRILLLIRCRRRRRHLRVLLQIRRYSRHLRILLLIGRRRLCALLLVRRYIFYVFTIQKYSEIVFLGIGMNMKTLFAKGPTSKLTYFSD